jgi:ARID/BRIGHT DNA binding domain
MQPDIIYINAGPATTNPATANVDATAATTSKGDNATKKHSLSSPSSLANEILGSLPFTTPIGSMPEGAFTDLFASLKINLIYLDAANTWSVGQKLYALDGVQHVICWASESPPNTLHAMYFAHVFFASLENQALIIPEAFAMAAHLTRTFCGRVDSEGKVSEPNLPRLLSLVPGMLPSSTSIPPFVQRDEFAVVVSNNSNKNIVGGGSSAPTAAAAAGDPAAAASPLNYNYNNINRSSLQDYGNYYSQIRLCSPHAEVRMMLTGLYEIINAHCMAHLCESFRAVLVAEVRSLKLVKIKNCTNPPAYLPPGSIAVQCEVRTATGIAFTVMLGGPSEALKNHSLVQHALRQTVTADAQALQLKLPPPGAPLPSIKKSAAVAGGAYCTEIMAVTSTWAIQVINLMCRNSESRALVSLGIAAVSNHPTSSFSKFDGNRFMAIATGNDPKRIESVLKSAEPAVMPGSVQKKPRVAPPMPVTAADAAAATAAVFAAAAAAAARNGAAQQQQQLQQGGNRPGTATVAGGSKTPALEGVAPRPPSAAVGQGLPPRPFPAGATAPAQTLIPNIPRIISSPSPNRNTNNSASRPPLDTCTEALFLLDLVNFLKTQLKRSVDLTTFPEVSLNGSKLDIFTLYREVCRRGGYNAANRIDWKNGVFPWMKNFSSGHKLTAIGNMLKHHYQSLLLDYERRHPEDVLNDGCVSCGDSGAGGDGMCVACRQGGSGRSSAAAVAVGDALMGPGGVVAMDTS